MCQDFRNDLIPGGSGNDLIPCGSGSQSLELADKVLIEGHSSRFNWCWRIHFQSGFHVADMWEVLAGERLQHLSMKASP